MAFKTSASPFLRLTERLGSRHFTVILLLFVLLTFSGIYYGSRPVWLTLSGVVTANLCELIACGVMHRRPTVLDGSATATGLMIGMMMSPLSPYWLPALAAAFAILVVKMPFGGRGHEPFVPAAAGLAFVTQCFPLYLFTYPAANLTQPLPLNDIADVVTATSPAATIASGVTPTFTTPSWMLGQIPGPLGTTAGILLIACMAGLFVRRITSPIITLSFISTCGLLAMAFPRIDADALTSMTVELGAGYLLFAGIFLLPESVTAPRHWLARLVYGVMGGCLAMLLRHWGRFEESTCFAILLMNALSPIIDRLCWRLCHHLSTRKEEAV